LPALAELELVMVGKAKMQVEMELMVLEPEAEVVDTMVA
jgi:hypothetical protein